MRRPMLDSEGPHALVPATIDGRVACTWLDVSESRVDLYDHRRSIGICVRCGVVSRPRRVLCQACANRQKDALMWKEVAVWYT